ncbi:MAG TPA: epoxide hydrolase [Actinomycetota bacterium]|nr:epoxide hydrolase [Actinomycetota bacterium]
MTGSVEAFEVRIDDAVLEDLSERLDGARMPEAFVLDGTEDAERLAEVVRLIEQWRKFDWRTVEERVNTVPQIRATVGNLTLHAVHVPGVGPDPLPLLLMNGWPSSFVEYLGVIGPLTDPAAHGGDPADAFSVVIPSMPGFGFSDRFLDRALRWDQVPDSFAELMTGVLGYQRFVVHGDDFGGSIANALAGRTEGDVVAVQTASWLEPRDPRNDAETAFVRDDERWNRDEGAYAHVQATRPQTLAFGLDDSPVGLAAWILDKWLSWSDPATWDAMDLDLVLANLTIYWATRTIASSCRMYALVDWAGPGPTPVVPTTVLVPNEPRLAMPPDAWLERAYPNLERVVRLERGGHFPAMEVPDRLVEEIRTTFRPHRG